MLIDIPKDIARRELDVPLPDTIDLPGYRPTRKRPPAADPGGGRRAIARRQEAGALRRRRRRQRRRRGRAAALAEKTQIPVVTTLLAKGAFPDSHTLSLQMPGMHGSQVRELGAQPRRPADHRRRALRRSRDRQAGRVRARREGHPHGHRPGGDLKNRHADVPIVGELREVLPQLTKAIAKLRESDSIATTASGSSRSRSGSSSTRIATAAPARSSPQYVIERLRDLLAGRDTIWTTGVGQHQMWAAQWLHDRRQPRAVITSGGLGTMGFGFPAALGAQARPARGDRRLHRRRRLLPDDAAGARDGRRLRHPGHRRRHEQRLARHGAPVAGAVPRRALLADAPERRDPRLREARRGLRRASASGPRTRPRSTSRSSPRSRADDPP